MKNSSINVVITSIFFGFIHFIVSIFIPFLIPIIALSYGGYIFFAEGRYIIALLFIITAMIFFVMLLKRKSRLSEKRIAWLKANGKLVMTEFDRPDRRWNIAVNGQAPLVIYTKAHGHYFQSEDIWLGDDDSFYIDDCTTRALKTLQSRDKSLRYLIPVYINTTKPKEYFMDLEGLRVGE